MVDGFALVLIITAQMIFHGRGHELVTGFLGGCVTLQFTFNVSVTNTSHFGVYITEKEKKISDNSNCRRCFDVYPKNSSVLYHIANLTSDDSELYWASLLQPDQVVKSNKVQLILREETKANTTVSQMPINSTTPQGRGSSSLFSSHVVIVLVVVPAVLLATVLPLLIYCFDKTRDRKQQQQQQASNPTLQEAVEVSGSPAPPLVYSVLNFPARPPAVVEPSPSDTDYAVVSCLPEKR